MPNANVTVPPISKFNIFVQVLVGLIFILVMYVASLVVLNIDSLIVNPNAAVKPHEHITILNGWASPSYMANKQYNTINSFSENFKKVPKSVNTMGGAQFAYQFWLKVDDASDDLFKDMVILLKGDNKKYKVGLYDRDSKALMKNIPDNHVITCPLIKFGKSYREFEIQLNTNDNPLTKIKVAMSPNSSNPGRQNLLSLLPVNWYLLTFCFEDNFSYLYSTETGIKFTLYINDFPYFITSASDNPELRSNFIKQNDGNLYLLPDVKNTGDFMKIANLKYYNYVPKESDIKKAYMEGPPTKSAVELNSSKEFPSYISAFNKIDVYNY